MGRALVAIIVGSICLSSLAKADSYDFKISQLGNAVSGADRTLANESFRAFARRLGAALSSANLSPPDTLGHSGFAFTAELSVVDFGGAVGPTQMPTEKPIVGSLLLPSVHFRKGLPASFEVGVRAAWFEKSRMGAGTLELKWALNEGFTFLPDIGVRGYVTKLLNTRDFDITTGGFDLGVGKQLPIAGMFTITPYLGWNLMFIGASTETVDFRTGRTLAEADSSAYVDYGVFQSVQAGQNTVNRFYLGLRAIASIVTAGVEFSYANLGSIVVNGTNLAEKPVLAFNFTLGVDF